MGARGEDAFSPAGTTSDGERTARQYDAMAADYAAENAENAYNAYYERPATIALLGPVQGLRVPMPAAAAVK